MHIIDRLNYNVSLSGLTRKGGEDTTFTLYLPVSEKKLAEPEKNVTLSHSGCGRILLMDDEAHILKMAGRMLMGMGDQEVIKELLKIDPNVNAVVSSGYSNDPFMSNFRDCGFHGVIPKPCSVVQVAEVLNKILLVS